MYGIVYSKHAWHGHKFQLTLIQLIHQLHTHGLLHMFRLGSVATFGLGAPNIIPEIIDDYIGVKTMFVNICTTQGSPTLDEVKNRCSDLIESFLTNGPLGRLQDDIAKTKTLSELGRVVCFRLSRWISYDFFKKVISHFQPALKHVLERLMHYEDQLKPFLLQKLEYIAELRQR